MITNYNPMLGRNLPGGLQINNNVQLVLFLTYLHENMSQGSRCYGPDSQETLVIPQCKQDLLSKLVYMGSNFQCDVTEMTQVLCNYIIAVMAGWEGS